MGFGCIELMELKREKLQKVVRDLEKELNDLLGVDAENYFENDLKEIAFLSTLEVLELKKVVLERGIKLLKASQSNKQKTDESTSSKLESIMFNVKDYDNICILRVNETWLPHNANIEDENENRLTMTQIKELKLFINPLDGTVYSIKDGILKRDYRYEYYSY